MNFLKRLRTEKLVMSQAKLAGICGTSQQVVSLWERGKMSFPADLAMSLYVWFGREYGVTLKQACL